MGGGYITHDILTSIHHSSLKPLMQYHVDKIKDRQSTLRKIISY